MLPDYAAAFSALKEKRHQDAKIFKRFNTTVKVIRTSLPLSIILGSRRSG